MSSFLASSSNSGSGLAVKSLGVSVPLGTLYDARSNKFLNCSVFKNYGCASEKFPPPLGCPKTTFSERISDSLHDKFKLFEVNASVSANILLGGGVDLNTSARFLKSSKSSKQEVRMTLLYSVQTVKTSFDYGNEDLRDQYDPSLVLNNSATHYVGQIVYGGNAALTLTHANSQSLSRKEIETRLKAAVDSIREFAQGGIELSGQKTNNLEIKSEELAFCLDADSDTSSKYPTTVDEAKALMRELVVENKLKCANVNKGSMLEYIVFPLSDLDRLLHPNGPLYVYPDYKLLTEENSIRLCSFYDSVHMFRLEIADAEKLFSTETYSTMISNTTIDKLESIKSILLSKESSWKESIASCFDQCTSEPISAVFNICLSKVETELRSYKREMDEIMGFVEKKMSLIKSVENLCKYVGKAGNVLTYCSKNCYVLTFTYEMCIEFPHLWTDNVSLMESSRKSYFFSDSHEYILLDLEFTSFFPDEYSVSRIGLHYFQKSSKKWEFDLLANGRREKSYVRLVGTERHRVNTMGIFNSPKRNLVIQCPLGCRSEQLSEWYCFSCKFQLKVFANSENALSFFCKCGNSPICDNFQFCCRAEEHGRYEPYPHSALTNAISSMDDKVITILLFGITGVGKTTFINSLANYMQESTLKKMHKSIEQLVGLVYAAYKYVDSNGISRTATIGEESEDEVFTVGQSSTQKCKTYVFYWSDRMIKIIDTPGVSDTRGLIHDCLNCDNIMGYLNHFTKVHAFLFLIDANESRLTLEFKHCFMQFAEKLHVSAIENIVFVYTKCHGIDRSCKAKDIIEALMTEVHKRTKRTISLHDTHQYSFDNDSFEWLVCAKHGMEKKRELFAEKEKSWEFSRESALKMLKHIKDNHNPHNIADSISVHFIRSTFNHLSWPIALLLEIISENKIKCSMLLNKMNHMPPNTQVVGEIAALEQVSVEVDRLPWPRTVCTHRECSTENVAHDGTQFRIYRHVCQEQCLNLKAMVTRRSVLLSDCFAPGHNDSSICNKCGHTWESHINTILDYKKKITFISPQTTAHQELNRSIAFVKNRLDDLERELQSIFEIAAQLAQFLKQHSIVPTSSVLGELIESDIVNRRMHAQTEEDKTSLQELEDFKRKYDAQMMVQADCNSSSLVVSYSLEEMLENIKKLYTLPMYGNVIERSVIVQKELPIYQVGAHFQPSNVRPNASFIGRLFSWKKK